MSHCRLSTNVVGDAKAADAGALGAAPPLAAPSPAGEHFWSINYLANGLRKLQMPAGSYLPAVTHKFVQVSTLRYPFFLRQPQSPSLMSVLKEVGVESTYVPNMVRLDVLRYNVLIDQLDKWQGTFDRVMMVLTKKVPDGQK